MSIRVPLIDGDLRDLKKERELILISPLVEFLIDVLGKFYLFTSI